MAYTLCALRAPRLAWTPAQTKAPALHRTLGSQRPHPGCDFASSTLSHVSTGFACREAVRSNAAASSDSGSAEPVKRSILVLALLFTGWYTFTIFFNIYNKQLLKIWLMPLTATTFQFFIGGILGLGWFLAARQPIVLRADIIKAVAPLAVVHVLANALTNLSLGLMAVSFTHTVKAMEPFFSVLLSMLFLHERPHPMVLLTLLPIVVGVIGASVSEISFTWLGFAAAMGSNLSLCFRNVLSKRFMTPDIKQLLGGAIGLFSMITMMSFLMLMPIAVAVEGVQLTPAALRAAGVEPEAIFKLLASSALCFHLYQQVSYMILSRVSPVSHSIGNCLKRVVVIVASVFFFKNPISTQSAAFTGIALLGVFAYSQAKRIYGSITMEKGKA
eukprot:jgi/Ulvmu1/3654/UM017_0068.1